MSGGHEINAVDFWNEAIRVIRDRRSDDGQLWDLPFVTERGRGR